MLNMGPLASTDISCTQCDHFQQFYNRHNVKVHVSITRWSHCAAPRAVGNAAATKYIDLYYKYNMIYLN